jgi:hypothetical protein
MSRRKNSSPADHAHDGELRVTDMRVLTVAQTTENASDPATHPSTVAGISPSKRATKPEPLHDLQSLPLRPDVSQKMTTICVVNEQGQLKGPARKTRRTNQNEAASPGSEEVRLLTVKQGAYRTQMSERDLRRKIKSGEIPVKRFGKAIRIHPKDLGL